MTEILLSTLLLTAILLGLSIIVVSARRILWPATPAAVMVNKVRKTEAQSGETLLSSLTRSGVLIPSACGGSGTCGLCRVTVTEGGGDPLPTEAARLSRAELRSGMRLACQVKVRGDLSVDVPESLIGAESVTCTLASARFLTPLIREIVLQYPKGRIPEIAAGSFIQLTLPPYGLEYADIAVPDEFEEVWTPLRGLRSEVSRPTTRAYSVSNRPEDTAAGRVVLNIRLALPPPHTTDIAPGEASSWLFGIKEGTPVEVAGPFGTFRAQETDKEMILIGGGVGMAPLRAIILERLEQIGTDRKISFWYGARSERELFYREEFDALAAKHPNFSWKVALSDPGTGSDWTGPTGFIHNVVWNEYLKDHPAPEDCEYYMCGPPMMMRAVLAMLDDAGVDKASTFMDDFGV